MLSMAWQFKHHPHTLRSQSKPGRAKSCTISGAIHETATISPVKTKSITIKLPKLLFQHDKRERRFTPTGFFDTDPFTWSKRRLRGRVVEFKEAPNRDESKSGRRWESWRKPSSTSRSPPGKKGERVRISRSQVNQIYMDSGSSCEVIYEHCFLKLKAFIRSLRVESKIPLVGAKGWRMGVDFTDINKACLKDYYPLPEINRTMESLSGFQLKYVLDAYKGYHQLQMAEGDKGETYQRLVDKVFNDQIGRNLKGYNDDMVIKSASEEDMLMDIQETFDRIRSINMKLNQKKCSFGVKEGPFLGQLITKHGIKANHSNVKEITDLKPPSTLKEIQILKGKLAALS
nr:reverse transcriptase domain-containing protein [Tanacetum cinerariifolium]